MLGQHGRDPSPHEFSWNKDVPSASKSRKGTTDILRRPDSDPYYSSYPSLWFVRIRVSWPHIIRLSRPPGAINPGGMDSGVASIPSSKHGNGFDRLHLVAHNTRRRTSAQWSILHVLVTLGSCTLGDIGVMALVPLILHDLKDHKQFIVTCIIMLSS